MADKSVKQLLRDARRRVRSNWIKGSYVIFPDIGEAWGPDCTLDTLRDQMERAKQKSANPECRVCAEGAIYVACALAGDRNEDRARETIDKYITPYLPEHPTYLSRYESVPSFNDDDPTTQEDVLKLLERAEEAA